jgi:UDP-N-acetylglucosamine--N-acetylmuramyl-(pentapeptide) pyrophosphoryl-undecaprenol N-acetylglucosamine transferase
MQQGTRILMVAGGTGGHVFPTLVVAEELRARSERPPSSGARFDIEFLGTMRPLESRLIPAAGFPLRTVAAAGLKGIGGWQKLRNLWLLPRTALEAARVLRAFQPRVVVGIGGYLAGPVMLEAALRGIPTLLMEPNARPGFTNRVLAPVVRKAAVGFKQTAGFYGSKAQVTGHPVRKAFFETPAKEHRCPFTVLIVGGSQGSKAINEAVIASLPLLATEQARLRFIHQTGEQDYNLVCKAYQERGFNSQVHIFVEDMPGAFAQADLVVSRAGATAVAELAAAGKAALLIPFPAATDQHQLENARVLEQAGAARLIEQAALTPERLVGEIRNLLSDPSADGLRRMERQARSLACPDAAARIADMIASLAISA